MLTLDLGRWWVWQNTGFACGVGWRWGADVCTVFGFGAVSEDGRKEGKRRTGNGKEDDEVCGRGLTGGALRTATTACSYGIFGVCLWQVEVSREIARGCRRSDE